jgi:phosphate transport system protein
MSMHPSPFHDQLDALQQDVLKMGTIVEQALDEAVRALAVGDLEAAQRVIAGDDELDRMEIEIEQTCLTLIALHQPLAGDLRVLGTALKLVTDIERIGDHAVDIAKVVIRLDAEPLIKPLIDIPEMADVVRRMLRECLSAYVRRDPTLAREVMGLDDQVDHLYSKVFRDLLARMIESPDKTRQGAYLLLVAQYLERVGDHATNFGEWIVYMVTGERVDLNA